MDARRPCRLHARLVLQLLLEPTGPRQWRRAIRPEEGIVRSDKPYTNVTFTKRVDHEAGRHCPPKAQTEPLRLDGLPGRR